MKIRQNILILIFLTSLSFILFKGLLHSHNNKDTDIYASKSDLFIEKLIDKDDILFPDNDLTDIFNIYLVNKDFPIISNIKNCISLKFKKIIPRNCLIYLYLDIPPPSVG